MINFAVVFGATFLSSFVQISTGFGFAIVLMALAPLVLPYEIGLYLSLIGGATLGIWLVWKYRHTVQWKKTPLPIFFSSIGALAGLSLGARVSGGIYMQMLGAFLVILALWFLFFSQKIHIPGTPLSAAIAGVIAGVLNALFAMSGPPLVLYYISVIKEKEAYISTLNLVLTASAILTAIFRTILIGPPTGLSSHFLPWALAMASGAYAGKIVFNRINTDQLKKLVYLFMCVVGIYFLLTN